MPDKKSPTFSHSLSVFFPAYNEEKNIEETVRATDAVLKELVSSYEIIVINDGSKDATGSIADGLAAENPRVKVIHHSPNQGYGAAVWSGVQAATSDYVFFTDADLQFDISEIRHLLVRASESNAVLGYRAKRRDPFMRLLNAWGWNKLNRALFGLKVKDIDCAFKLFRRSIVADLPVKSRGAMLSAEMLIRLQRKGVVFTEVPVTHLPRKAGSPTGAKLSVIFRAFRELFSVYQGDLGNQTYIAAGKFALVGIMNTLIDWVAYYSLTRGVLFFGDHPASAKMLAFMAGTIPSFIVNRYWTFGLSSSVRVAEVGRFYMTVLSALVLNVISLYVLVHTFGVYDLVAVVLATGISFIWNFTLARTWVFKDFVLKAPSRI